MEINDYAKKSAKYEGKQTVCSERKIKSFNDKMKAAYAEYCTKERKSHISAKKFVLTK